MPRRHEHQLRLSFGEEQALPSLQQARCRELLSQLLLEVVRAERAHKEKRNERENHRRPS